MLMLVSLIEEKGISQKELAEKINLAPQTINNYVKGHRMPDVATIGKLCDVLDCSADYLIGRSKIRKPYITARDKAILDAYRNAGKRDRELVDKILGLETDPPQSRTENDLEDKKSVQVGHIQGVKA